MISQFLSLVRLLFYIIVSMLIFSSPVWFLVIPVLLKRKSKSINARILFVKREIMRFFIKCKTLLFRFIRKLNYKVVEIISLLKQIKLDKKKKELIKNIPLRIRWFVWIRYISKLGMKIIFQFDKYFNKTNPSLICFIHSSDEHRTYFTSATKVRPTFYWLTNKYFEHMRAGKNRLGNNKPCYRYFYFFIKDTKKEKIAFRARHGKNLDFNDMYQYFNYYLLEQIRNAVHGFFHISSYSEPSIMMSFSHIKPDLVARYYESINDFAVLKPDKYKRMHLNIFDKKTGRSNHFYKTKLPIIFPNIKQAIPFNRPRVVNGKYYYKNWIPMITETMGTWL